MCLIICHNLNNSNDVTANRRNNDRTPISWKTRFKLALRSARGFSFIHTSGNNILVHGNIKSQNILITQTGEARIANTGMAPMLNFPFPSSISRCAEGYQAPEVSQNGQHTQRSDVYSFGVLLLEIVTSKLPRQGHTDKDFGVVVEMVDNLPGWVLSVTEQEGG